MRRILVLLALAACGGGRARSTATTSEPGSPPGSPPAAAPVAPSAPEVLTADSPRTTTGGATFVAPAGWSMAVEGSVVTLESPEKDSRIALVDVTAADASAALAAAWKAYRPDANRKLLVTQKQPGRDGWEETHLIQYETPPNEKATVWAAARRHGTRWNVMIVDASQATAERRGAQIAIVGQSVRPAGHQDESFAGKTAHPLDAARIGELRAFLEESMKALDVPGVAFALIQDGKVVHVEGLGVRQLGKKAKIDGDTLFQIASNTKAFTTLLLAKLVDAGKVTWDTPVVDVYPGFALGDAETTKKVRIRHLICACTGLPRQDYEWLLEYGKATPASNLALLGTMQPTSEFGEVFQYSNLMAAAAGFIAGHLYHPKKELGAAYDEAMRKEIFGPLGIKAVTFDVRKVKKTRNHAVGHGDDLLTGGAGVADIDINRSVISVRPTGGAWMSARDLAKFVQLELAAGVLPGGKRLVSAENLLARREPQIATGEKTHYGMGLIVDRFWGIPIVRHGGSMIGYKSQMYWLPEHGVGAVLLTNADSGHALLAGFQRRLLEVLFDGQPEAAEDLAAAAAARKAEIKAYRDLLVIPADATAVGALANRYRSDALGEIAVIRKGGKTYFDFGEWKSEVASRKNLDGTVSFMTIEPGMAGFEFVVGERDGKRVLVTRDAQHEYVFVEA